MNDQFLEAVRLQMQPEGRAQHTMHMQQRLLPLLPDGVTLADLVAGWLVLAKSHNENDLPAILHRRETCAELAAIAAQLTNGEGNVKGAVSAWQAWLDAFRGSTDPREASLVKIFEREVVELRAFLQPGAQK